MPVVQGIPGANNNWTVGIQDPCEAPIVEKLGIASWLGAEMPKATAQLLNKVVVKVADFQHQWGEESELPIDLWRNLNALRASLEKVKPKIPTQ